MNLRGRIVGVLTTLVVSAALTGATALTPAVAAAPAIPPACATTDPNQNCVHAPTPDITALPAPPAITTSYDTKHHLLTVAFTAAIIPPYHQCPDGGVPYAQIPCSFRGLGVNGRIYQPGAKSLLTAGPLNPNIVCDFSCPVSMVFGYTYHGPATMILRFQILDLIVAANDLTTSTYETTVQLPAEPTSGAVHPVKPKVVMSGKLRNATLHLAGKAGIPRAGVGGVLVRVFSTGEGQVKGADGFGNGIGTLEVVPGTTVKITKTYPGNVTVTVMGWYSSKPALTGSLIHVLYAPKKVRVAAALHLKSAGVPLDATGAILAVHTAKGTSTVGGAVVNKSYYTQFILVPLTAGAVVAVKAAKGALIAVVGYTEPIQPVDDGTALVPTYGQSLNGMFSFRDPF